MERKFNLTPNQLKQALKNFLSETTNPTFKSFAEYLNTYPQLLRYYLKRLGIYDEINQKLNDAKNNQTQMPQKSNTDKKLNLPTVKDENTKKELVDAELINELQQTKQEYDSYFARKFRAFIESYFNNKKNKAKIEHKIGFMCDIHIGQHNEQAIISAVDYLKDKNIDTLILGGDIADFDSISYWLSVEKYTLKEEIEMIKEFLSWLRQQFPKTKIYYIKGNHSERIERFLMQNAKQLLDLDVLQIPYLFKFHKFDIIWIDNKELLHKYNQPFKIGRLAFLHGNEIKTSWSVVNVARTLFLKTFTNIVFGHFHTTQEYVFRTLNNEILGAWSVGCLCSLFPEYRPVNNWNNGFAYIEVYTNGDFVVENKKIIKGQVL